MKVKTPVGIPDPELKPYAVVYEPPPPHVCKMPRSGEFLEGTIIECLECGQHWKLQMERAVIPRVFGLGPGKAPQF